MGVKWPEDEREFIICEWFREFPMLDVTTEWLISIRFDERDCCDCWSIWSRGGDIGSDLIFTGTGEDGGGGVLFDIAKWGIPLK